MPSYGLKSLNEVTNCYKFSNADGWYKYVCLQDMKYYFKANTNIEMFNVLLH